MNEYQFTAEVARQTRVPNAVEFFRDAAGTLRERAYGNIVVHANWMPLASDDDIVRIDLRVTGDCAAADIPAYVELFFHDAFLLFNVALPGSFGGAITATGGEFRVNDLSFDAAPFACGAPSMPLPEVVAWYRPETNQIAATPMQTVLFHLLHIGRGDHDDWMQRARLNECLKALGIDESIDEIAVIHPMHDESLDARLDDSATGIVDRAMVRVLTAVQAAARAS
ncbi:MAG: hypothetical protein JO093_24645 [Acidobacteria bacterium]|nr:hypothetical protein [Acidobacteriota bacterium]MBV9188818.1 hypothetical protein [Acidobacteriota bacterium]